MAEAPSTDLCVLADAYLAGHEVRAIENAVRTAGVDVSLVVVNEPVDGDDPDAEAAAINDGIGLDALSVIASVLERERWWSLVVADKQIAALLGSAAADETRVPVEEVPCFEDAEIRHVTARRDGAWSELPAEAVDAVRERCDVAVRYGFGLLRGDVLDAPECGVLSFHPADIRRYRGLGPPMAWIEGRETVGVTLQRLTAEIDAGEVVAFEEVDVRECATLWEVYDTVHDAEVGLLAEGIRTLRDPETEPTVVDALGPYYPTTRRRELPFAATVLWRNLAGRARRLR